MKKTILIVYLLIYVIAFIDIINSNMFAELKSTGKINLENSLTVGALIFYGYLFLYISLLLFLLIKNRYASVNTEIFIISTVMFFLGIGVFLVAFMYSFKGTY